MLSFFRRYTSLNNSISHELRTPIHGMLALTELLCDTSLNETQMTFLKIIETCGKNLLDLINNVLGLVRHS